MWMENEMYETLQEIEQNQEKENRDRKRQKQKQREPIQITEVPGKGNRINTNSKNIHSQVICYSQLLFNDVF